MNRNRIEVIDLRREIYCAGSRMERMVREGNTHRAMIAGPNPGNALAYGPGHLGACIALARVLIARIGGRS